MTNQFTRRHSLKLITAGTLAGIAGREHAGAQTPGSKPVSDPWAKTQ
jgi:hypothetical protein